MSSEKIEGGAVGSAASSNTIHHTMTNLTMSPTSKNNNSNNNNNSSNNNNNSSSNTSGIGEKALHAHIECSRGISAYSVLEAALGIARDLDVQDKWINEIEDLMPRIFGPDLLTTVYLRPEAQPSTSSSASASAGGGGSTTTTSTVKDNVNFVARPISVYLQALDSKGNDHFNLLLSPWLRQQAKAVLRELIDPARPASADPASLTVAHIVAALWCLDRLGVRSCTCSPLAWTSVPTITSSSSARAGATSPTAGGSTTLAPPPAQRLIRRDLFVGLPTILDTESFHKRTTGDGIALLRVLTGVSLDPTKPITRQAPPMVLRASSSGQDDGSGDDVIYIGLSLGELMRDAAHAHPLESTLWKTDYDMKLIQANIDDMTPEHLGLCVELLMSKGNAADAWITPIVMKKGRAAHMLECMCRVDQIDVILPLIFLHTTTLGIRVVNVDRVALPRKLLAVETEWSPKDRVNVKVGYLGTQCVSVKAEFDHCKLIAIKSGVPVQAVARQAERRAEVHLAMETRKQLQQQGGGSEP
jgi:Protein of unknown function DUF111